MNVPDWLWQGLSVWAVGKGIEWAWIHRKVIAVKLGLSPEDIVINLQPLTLRAEAQPVSATVGKSVDLRWNVEAPTPSLARRLEDLLSWYLHVS